MALINCPECGKEISDMVKRCPNCGYPIKKKTNSRIIVVTVIVLSICIIGGVVYNQIVLKPLRTYKDAVALYEQEKYDEASLLFDKISNYKDVPEYKKLIETENAYQEAIDLYNQEKYEEASDIFNTINEYKDVSEYQDLIASEAIYQEASDLYKQREYDKAGELFSKIKDYKDVPDIQDQMKKDKEFNEYIDNVTKFGFFAESAVLQADDLLDDITSIWYNCIYGVDNYFTDKYTKDYKGDFFDDFNTALIAYFWSDDYSRAEENIKDNQTIVDDYYSKLKNAPEELKDLSSKVAKLQSSYTTMVEFALNPEGSYNSVAEGQHTKKEAFEMAYNDLKVSIPDKKIINPSENKNMTYDFRHVNFGMTQDEVIESEVKNYNLSTSNVFSWGFIIYENVDFENGYYGEITYSFDKMRVLDSIWIDFEKGTTEDQVLDIVSSWYQDKFNGENFIFSDEEYPDLRISIDVGDDDTTLYIYPISKDEYNDYLNMLSQQETENITEPESEIEAETEDVVKEENTFETESDGMSSIDIEYDVKIFKESNTAHATSGANMRQTPAQDGEIIATIPTDDTVTVIGATDKWYKIEYDDMVGYVNKNLFSIDVNNRELNINKTEETEINASESQNEIIEDALIISKENRYPTLCDEDGVEVTLEKCEYTKNASDIRFTLDVNNQSETLINISFKDIYIDGVQINMFLGNSETYKIGHVSSCFYISLEDLKKIGKTDFEEIKCVLSCSKDNGELIVDTDLTILSEAFEKYSD